MGSTFTRKEKANPIPSGISHKAIVDRFSVFAAVGFNAVLGWYLFNGFEGLAERSRLRKKRFED